MSIKKASLKVAQFPAVDASQPAVRDPAHNAWCHLDTSCNTMRQANALLATTKIALLNPDHELDDDTVVDTLNILQELLYQIHDGIDSAREIVHGLDQSIRTG